MKHKGEIIDMIFRMTVLPLYHVNIYQIITFTQEEHKIVMYSWELIHPLHVFFLIQHQQNSNAHALFFETIQKCEIKKKRKCWTFLHIYSV